MSKDIVCDNCGAVKPKYKVIKPRKDSGKAIRGLEVVVILCPKCRNSLGMVSKPEPNKSEAILSLVNNIEVNA